MADRQHSWDALLEDDPEDLYEHAPCGYLSMLPDGTIGKVNATLLSWTGYPRDALVGQRRFVDLLTVGGRIFYETHFHPLLRMQGFVREIAFDLACASGARLPVLVNASQREFAGVGTITRVTVFDASDRRRYERELLGARDRAEQAARAKSDLIAMISHDVRAPLSAMITALALIEKTSLTPQQARYVRVLRSSCDHALGLVNNVLESSRIDAGRTLLREAEFSVRDLAQEVTAAARAAAMQKPELDVTLRVDEAVPQRVIGDETKLQQVLTNLMMNAVKFTHRGLVSLMVVIQDTTAEAVTLQILVTDTGIGIPADRLPHIFEEFTQGSDDIAATYGGTGLGLSIVRKLLRLQGSELRVTSTVGQGTTFSFLLRVKRPADVAGHGTQMPA
jgi:signal transduction histidine kinase